MSSVRISLVIPSYNRGALIAETIESALAQTTPFHEIIVVDDGSTDETRRVAARYSDRIRFIALENGGVQRARNAGAATATGDYIALCDSDDLLEPDFVSTNTACLQANADLDAIYCNFQTFNRRGIQMNKFEAAPPGFFAGARRVGDYCFDIDDLYARLLSYQPLFPTGSVIRKSFYDAIGGYDVRFKGVGSEDLEFTLRVVGQGRVALCMRPLTRVRKHDGNISGTPMRQTTGEIAILEYALQNHRAAQRYAQAVQDSIRERRIDLFNTAFARGDFHIASDALARMKGARHDRKLKIKAMIMHMPRLVGRPLWRISQG
jgi:glycosyltransferase involved in cell wall biosynthesis